MTSKKSEKPKSMNKVKVSKHHVHFGGVLVLFLGLSLYAMVSFFQSTNLYVNQIQTNVLRVNDLAAEEIMDASEVPVDFGDNLFLDLNEDHLNRDAVVALYYQGIVKGGDDGNFRPDDFVNRAEFAKMIVEAKDIDLTSIVPIEACFNDVTSLAEQWFAPYVCAAKAERYVSGYDGGLFIADKRINKAESLKIVLSAFDFDLKSNVSVVNAGFSDLSAGDWFLSVAESAARNNLIASGGNFDAAHEMTRGEVAQVIYNAMMAQDLL